MMYKITPSVETKERILSLDPMAITYDLAGKDIVHIFKTLDGLWQYDYQALRSGRPGFHAELKSGRCSDGFLNAHIVLAYENVRRLLAKQIAMKFRKTGLPNPDYVVGIPTGATKLGQDVAEILGCNFAEMVKDENGKLQLITEMPQGSKVLIVEDFCTKATGSIEAIIEITTKQKGWGKEVLIYPIELLIINRGGLRWILVPDCGYFQILPLANLRINDWGFPCQLCEAGSQRIKPKATAKNWQIIRSGQLP